MPAEPSPASVSGTTPVLTIAVPTYNREQFLREFLAVAVPQLLALQAQRPGAVEFICSDNGSTDGTAALLDETERLGVQMHRLRQTENIGPDRNFAECFHQARGRYFWLCGDDDILRPGAIETVLDALSGGEYDLVFMPPEPFQTDWRTEYKPDPYSRGAQVIESAREMALRVNVMVTFITGMVVNRARLQELHAEPPENFIGTNLVQLSWTLPLLREHRRSLILWQRIVAGRTMNSGGYSVGKVFGERFLAVAHRLLPDQPRLASTITDVALRQWFPATLLELRGSDRGNHFALHEAEESLRHTFRDNFRFWLFTWPVIRLPLPAARVWCRAGREIGRIIGLLQLPGEPLRKLRCRLNSRPA